MVFEVLLILLLFLSGEYPGSAFYGATEALIVRGHSQAKQRAVLFLTVFTISGFCSEYLYLIPVFMYFLLHSIPSLLSASYASSLSPLLFHLLLVSLFLSLLLSPPYYSIQYKTICLEFSFRSDSGLYHSGALLA